jgi:hypothetical protein
MAKNSILKALGFTDWETGAILLTIVVGVIILGFFQFSVFTAFLAPGANPSPPTPQTIAAVLGDSMTADVAVLVSIAVVASFAGARVRGKSNRVRAVYYFGFVTVVMYLFYAMLRSAWGVEASDWVPISYVNETMGVNYVAWVLGIIVIVFGLLTIFAPNPEIGATQHA